MFFLFLPKKLISLKAGPSKVKRARGNLSWLRKSMKKLNPFQLPQVEPPVASTSVASPGCSSDKLALVDNEQTEALRTSIKRCSHAHPTRICSTSSYRSSSFTSIQADRDNTAGAPTQFGSRRSPLRRATMALP